MVYSLNNILERSDVRVVQLSQVVPNVVVEINLLLVSMGDKWPISSPTFTTVYSDSLA